MTSSSIVEDAARSLKPNARREDRRTSAKPDQNGRAYAEVTGGV